MNTAVTVKVVFDHDEWAARAGIPVEDVPADIRAFIDDVVAFPLRESWPEPAVTYTTT